MASSLVTYSKHDCFLEGNFKLDSSVPSSATSLVLTALFLCLWVINVFWRRPQSSSPCLTPCRLTHSCVVRRWSQFEPPGQQASRQTVSTPQRLETDRCLQLMLYFRNSCFDVESSLTDHTEFEFVQLCSGFWNTIVDRLNGWKVNKFSTFAVNVDCSPESTIASFAFLPSKCSVSTTSGQTHAWSLTSGWQKRVTFSAPQLVLVLEVCRWK